MKMEIQILPTILQYLVVYSSAFEDFIYVYGDGNREMAKQGRVQYQVSGFLCKNNTTFL